jgi:4-diphosphocytidyl-2-C-methyl-D-erythritol kinase
VVVRARAKVNLGLEILGRRADGYHEISSLLWAIDLCDRVTIEAAPEGIVIACDADGVPATEENLAWRAADLLRRETGERGGVRIRLDKAIPVAAGLGGGSADAAAVLAGLGRLWNARVSPARLMRLATALGMDVPFFLGRGPVVASGRGEVVRPVAATGTIPLVIVNPGFPLATREVYARLGPADFSSGSAVRALRLALAGGVSAVAAQLWNGLERVVGSLWPGLAEVKGALVEAGCLGAVMSGSGPTVVGVAPSSRAARRIAERLQDRPWRLWVARTVSGPALTISGGGSRIGR